MQPKGRITPLWIIAAFLTLTEAVLGYAVTQTTDGVQIALTCFVIGFALLVAAAFFVILWNRPFVFYSPSEYGSIDPKTFISAMKSSISPMVAEQVQMVRQVGEFPDNKDAQFCLIDSLIDDVSRQHLILMFEQHIEIPFSHFSQSHRYELGTRNESWAGGVLSGRDLFRKLEGTRFLEPPSHNRQNIRLTDDGKQFAKWLTNKGKKTEFFQTPFGSWGTPFRPGQDVKRDPAKKRNTKQQSESK